MKHITLKKRAKLKELLANTINKKTIYLRADGNWQEYKSEKNGYTTPVIYTNTTGSLSDLTSSKNEDISGIKKMAENIFAFFRECERICGELTEGTYKNDTFLIEPKKPIKVDRIYLEM